MTHTRFALPVALLLIGTTACTLEFEEDIATTSSEVACPFWGCGSNDDGLLFKEIENKYSSQGLGTGDVRSVVVNGQGVRLHVENGEFHAVDDGGTVAGGDGMVGAVIRMRIDGEMVDLEITNRYTHPSAVTTSIMIPVYEMEYTNLTTGEAGILCPGGGIRGPGAVLIQGERYDPVSKTVSSFGAAAADWFNIACLGSVLAKLKFNLYDPEISLPRYTTTPAQRQAMIKAYVADYCGTGRSFTVAGQELHLETRSGTLAALNTSNPEAIWDSYGAVALDVPRRMSQEPDILDEIIAECGGVLPGWPTPLTAWPTSRSDIKTYNP